MKAHAKPRVERAIQYVQKNFFAGEDFIDLADVRRRAELWCRETAGMRIHGTTCLRPAEVFRVEELPLLGQLPGMAFDIPTWSSPKVHKRDFHVEVDRAIYSVSYLLRGRTLKARADTTTVKLYHKGELVKVWAKRAPGSRSSDPADFPPGKEIYATRDVEALKKMAVSHGAHIGTYAASLLDTPYPWTRMRQAYRLLGLVKKWGADRVESACKRALDAEATDNVNLISRMIERKMEEEAGNEDAAATHPIIIQGRFARDVSEFAATKRGTK